jgi:hypothetical protein
VEILQLHNLEGNNLQDKWTSTIKTVKAWTGLWHQTRWQFYQKRQFPELYNADKMVTH